MGGIASVLYGGLVYLVFLPTFLYAIAFVDNLSVPKTIDSGEPGPAAMALLVDTLLLGLFAILALLLLYGQWQPMPAMVWSVTSPAGVALLHAIFWVGWALVLISTFLINHFELFGLRQVYARLRGRTLPAPQFRT